MTSDHDEHQRTYRTGTARGFTLIELLVVISIIALLIGILLPALSRARDAAFNSGCLANQKQLATAFFSYAVDYEVLPGGTDHGPTFNLDWSGFANRKGKGWQLGDNPFPWGTLFPYVSGHEAAVECPKAKRLANLYFDYTLVAGLAGARPELNWFVEYPLDGINRNGERGRFPAIPMLIEEDEIWYNSKVMDGTWAWYDKFSDRHQGRCNIAYLDGSSGSFESPKGPDPFKEEGQDLTALDLILLAGTREYSSLYRSSSTNYGWINHPHYYK